MQPLWQSRFPIDSRVRTNTTYPYRDRGRDGTVIFRGRAKQEWLGVRFDGEERIIKYHYSYFDPIKEVVVPVQHKVLPKPATKDEVLAARGQCEAMATYLGKPWRRCLRAPKINGLCTYHAKLVNGQLAEQKEKDAGAEAPA